MIQFHAGMGPDSQAIGIALEEMYLNYVVAPARAPVPVAVVGQARMPDAHNILMSLAHMTRKFLPADPPAAAPWLLKAAPPLEALEAALSANEFILGPYTVADMAMYPRHAFATDLPPATAAWRDRLRLRPEVGRGMGVVAG